MGIASKRKKFLCASNFVPDSNQCTCIFALKEKICVHCVNGSPVYVWFKNVPLSRIYLPLLLNSFVVGVLVSGLQRSGALFSPFFSVSNGLSQGGVLSPSLFSMYLYELGYSFNQYQCWLKYCRQLQERFHIR